MKLNIVVYKYLALILLLSFSSCQKYIVIRETGSSYEHAVSDFPDLIPLRVADLREMLQADTSHYKLVVVYNVGCGACEEYITQKCQPYACRLDSDRMRVFYIHMYAGGLEYVKPFWDSCGLHPADYYYFRDDSIPYLAHGRHRNANRLKNIVEDVYGVSITSNLNWSSHAWLSDKHNRLKLQYVEDKNPDRDEVWYEGLMPAEINLLDAPDVLDYSVVDTLVINTQGAD